MLPFDSNLIQLLQEKIEGVKFPKRIVALYLYGSILKGDLRRESDIDIAMLPSHKVKALNRLNLIAMVEAEMKSIFRALGYDRDISVLDMRGKYVSVPLLFKIVTEGVLFYERNREERIDFENAVKGEYFDLKPYINSLAKEKYEELLEKTGIDR